MPLAAVANVTDPGQYIKEYNSLLSGIGETPKSYEFLMRIYQEYSSALKDANSSDSDRQSAITGLKWIFPYLANGVIYFFNQENEEGKAKALPFAEAYIDTYLNPAMASAELIVDQTAYPTIANFAASSNFLIKNYDKAIVYWNVYINSGATKSLKDALLYSSVACMKTNRNSEAERLLRLGLEIYPENVNMLIEIINLLGRSKSDDVSLQKYVSAALKLQPENIKLITLQAQLYERNLDFDNAVVFYKKLNRANPNSIEIERHLGINLYNSAARIINSGGEKSMAESRLKEAATLLSTVVDKDPLAKTYILGLAKTYSLLDDKQNLDRINSKLVALGETPIGRVDSQQLLAVNNEHISLSSIRVTQNSTANKPVAQQSGPPAKVETSAVKAEIAAAAVAISDVDTDIPVTGRQNDNTFAVIIANNDYKKVANVDNAENDGRIFAEYCNKVLGIPQSNIRTHFNVTYGELLDAVEDIKLIAGAKKGNLDVIFYYAGHGVPNEQTKSAYILPVDADGKQMRLCYPLSELYAELGAMNANKTLVFLDACFSGATRSSTNEMLLSARSVAIDVDPNEVEGKLVIFSASTGDQSALSYEEQHHGMFTYFLLKRLKETKGDINLGALAEYITDNVSLESQLRNKKQQIPTVIAGNEYGISDWKNLRLFQ